MYDFQKAVEAAKAVVERSENGGESRSYTYPLVYPQSGHTLTVRILFNPASGQIVRLINRHEKVACYRTYGVECPICKSMQQVKDMTGQDPFGKTKASRSRGICFAQYVSSTNPITKVSGSNEIPLKQGDIILLMFPWSVYTTLNQIIQTISQTPTGMDQAFSHANSGLFVNITVTNDFRYTTVSNPYMTFPSASSDEEFIKMLDGLESLSEQILPSTITEEVDKQVRAYNDEIYKQYIAPRVQNYGTAGVAPVNYSPQNIPVQPQVPAPQASGYVPPYTPPTTPTPVQYNAPAPQQSSCFGKHVDGAPQCICCPDEMNCIQSTPR